MANKKDDPFNPFANIDLTQFDPNKMLKDMKIPGIDMQQIIDAQRKNIEALTAANQVAVQGMQAVAQRQAEILAQAMSEMTSIAQELSSAHSAQEMSSKQSELAKRVFEQSLSNMRELAEMISKSNTEAFEVINKRVQESLNELRSLAAKK